MQLSTKVSALVLALLSLGPVVDDDFRPLFDGKSPAGWVTNIGKPLPDANVQPDGINPHKSGGYIVVYEKPFKDFVLDFDYKITKGCNSGVFLRVGKLEDPVNTGLEVAIDDTTGKGKHDTGAFYDLVEPTENAQKPAGEWNHMTIAAKGNGIRVELNDKIVSKIDLREFSEPGKRPDGSTHKFSGVAISDFNRPGYLGFQDHGQDCWFKNIRLKPLD
jgi:hypothetical protein